MNLHEEIQDIITLYKWMQEYDFEDDEIIAAMVMEYDLSEEVIRNIIDGIDGME